MFYFLNETQMCRTKRIHPLPKGKISELTDMEVEVYFFTSRPRTYLTYGYLEEECGVTVHHKPQTIEIYDKVFYPGP